MSGSPDDRSEEAPVLVNVQPVDGGAILEIVINRPGPACGLFRGS